MTIATKSGSLIVKDGKIAEGCECCVDICSQDYSGVTSVNVTISSGPDFLRQRLITYKRGATQFTQKESHGIFTSLLDGNHSLSKQTSGFQSSTWSKTITGQPSGCGNITITLELFYVPSSKIIDPFPSLGTGYQFSLLISGIRATVRAERSSNASLTQFYTLDDMSCNSSFSDNGTVWKVTGSSARQIFLVGICQNNARSTLPTSASFTLAIAGVSSNLLGTETEYTQTDTDTGSNVVVISSVEVA
jgi:hypothetical protein